MLTKQINCLGLSHHHTPVGTLERVLFSVDDLKSVLMRDQNMLESGSDGRFSKMSEMVLLSTCNRIEMYACIDTDPSVARDLLYDLLVEGCREARRQAGWESTDDAECIARENVEKALYHYNGDAALSHLCSVASGLDSMVLGETQILTQISTAHERAVEADTVGPVLTKVFHAAQRSGKLARSRTAISRNSASISSVAVSTAQELTGDLSQRDAAVVGMGEMGRQAVKVLVGRGVQSLRLVNRSPERAGTIAAHLENHAKVTCHSHSFDALPEALAASDVVIVATGANEFIVDADMVRDVMSRRPGRDLVIVDISVPRNVDPRAGDIDGVSLIDNDGLKVSLDEAMESRRREIPKVEAIISKEIELLKIELRKLRVKPLITELRRKAEAIRQQELARTYRMFGNPDPTTWSHVQHLSRSLINKLFHEPTMRIEEEAANGEIEKYESTVRRLFGLTKSNDG